MDRDIALPRLTQVRAEQHPDALAYMDVDGQALTWLQAHEGNLRWADAYRRAGVTAGDTVVTMLPSKLETFQAWQGAAWLGAVEVPINVMYVGDMLRYIVNDSEAQVMVLAEAFVPALREVIGGLPNLKAVVVPDAHQAPDLPVRTLGRSAFLGDAMPAELAPPQPHDIACMIYTSGTTGPSKGVLVPWGCLYEFPASLPQEGLQSGQRFYSFFPAFHVSGKNSAYLPAVRDATLVQREWFSVEAFWSDIRTHHCETAGLLGPMAMFLAMQPPRDDDADHPCRFITMGPLIPDVEGFKKRFDVQVSTGFGMTEIGVPLGTSYDLPDGRTCGKVRPGYEVRIVDEQDYEVAPDTVGELIVRSDEPWKLNAGYWKLPDRTAAAWRNGWFHTGDAFKRDEAGNHYFVDRIKDAIRRRGENISSFEVEGLVVKHPGVAEVAAVGVDALSEQDVKVCVVRSDAQLTHQALHAFCSETMPRFMVPRYIEFVDALPKTPTQRVQKAGLRADPLTEATWDSEVAKVG